MRAHGSVRATGRREVMAPVRIGIVGCGAIAQIQHLPNLAELREEFDVAAVCDCSPALA